MAQPQGSSQRTDCFGKMSLFSVAERSHHSHRHFLLIIKETIIPHVNLNKNMELLCVFG